LASTLPVHIAQQENGTFARHGLRAEITEGPMSRRSPPASNRIGYDSS
jgi:hypothetical protein